MTKFRPPARLDDTKSTNCQVCETALDSDVRYIAQPCGHGTFCYGCTQKLKMRPSKPGCKRCGGGQQRFIKDFEEYHEEQEAETLLKSPEIPTLLPFSNDKIDSPQKSKHHEYLSGQGSGDVHSMAVPIPPGRGADEEQESRLRSTTDTNPECEVREVKVSGGSALVETAEGLFAAEELNNDPSQDEELGDPTKAEDAVRAEQDPLLSILRDATILLEIGLSIELGKTKAIILFKEGKLLESAEMLTRCINSYIQAESANVALRSVLHSNRALAVLSYIKLMGAENSGAESLYRTVVKDCDSALHYDRDNTKALYRRALALNELDDLERSLEDISRVLAIFSSRNESHAEAVALREAVMAKRRALEKKWGMTGPISVSRLWNKPTGRPPADESITRPSSIQTSKLVTMPVTTPSVILDELAEKAAGVKERKARPAGKPSKGVLSASTLENELRRLKTRVDSLVDFVSDKLTPSRLEAAAGSGPAGLSALDPDCTGAMLHGLCRAAERGAIDGTLLCDYIVAMSNTRMVNSMVMMMLDQSERECLGKLERYVSAVANPSAVRARSILTDWHERAADGG
ncbi:hypothetical protein FOZ61_006146 [Perkinsus olseni]|uniref:RING-type domain-containing protein n=1 Tax=Perkinsus olseni TaxID=32597 RepID=A0A7J6LEL6_PEROL|nr:hypothetical protein FOZ61_006146 [Perkinsus olseni]